MYQFLGRRRRVGGTCALAAALLIVALGPAVEAQRSDRGSEDRGDREGFRGGPPFGGGSPFGDGPRFGGGSPFGGGGPDPSDFLRRLDENGNGLLDPDESQGRARFFLERIAQQVPQFDFSRPVPIDRLARAMREAREGGGDSGRDRDSRSSSASPAALEPLVPGFGLEEGLPPPPGFGAQGEIFAVSVTDADRRESEERMRRYDSNKDGILQREEIARGRWSDDPLVYDRNHDGQLTASELAVRYAQRRRQEDGRRGNSDRNASSSRSSSGTSSRSNDSGGLDPRMQGMVSGLFDRYDANRSGVLERDEWRNFRTPPDEADANRDQRITKEELAAWMGQRFGGFRGRDGGDARGSDRRSDERGGFSGRGFGDRGGFGDRSGSGERGDGRGSFFSRREDRNGDEARRDSSGGTPNDSTSSYRFKSLAERLPNGLPDWFGRSDSDADGQIAMSEFTSNWTDAARRDFRQFDLNGDGIITAAECVTAVGQGAVRGSSSGGAVSASSSPGPRSMRSGDEEGSRTTAAADIDQRYLKYYSSLMSKYDQNGDGVLTGDEWQRMSRNPAEADSDGDGRVTVEELTVWSTKR